MKLNLESEVFANIFQAPVLHHLLIQALGDSREQDKLPLEMEEQTMDR